MTGRLTKKPELRYTTNNKVVASFSIAVNRPYINENGEKEVDFINCSVWGKQAENLNKYQDKGNLIAINGRIQVRNYDDSNGNKRYVTEVIAEEIEYLQKTDKEKNTEENINISNSSKNIIEPNNPYEEFGRQIAIDENELPF